MISSDEIADLARRLLDPSVAALRTERKQAADALEQQAHEIASLRAALKQINDYPINFETGLVSADVLDIAADALGLCRECGETLVLQGRGCSICGAYREPDTRGTDTPEHEV